MVTTCRLCALRFTNVSDQHNHFRTPLHCHNLRRKVCGLPCISDVEYQEFIRNRSRESRPTESDDPEEAKFTCSLCRKQFLTDNQLRNHLKSRKHKDKEDGQVLGDNQESTNDTNLLSDEVTLPCTEEQKENPQRCLFCKESFLLFDQLMKHMQVQHSFEIPLSEYVPTPEALICHLRNKIEILLECISCHSRRFSSMDGVRKHMLDKGHVTFDPLSDRNVDFADFYSIPEESAVEEDSSEEWSDNDYEMELPSGSVIGHRALRVYYRQRVRPVRDLTTTADNHCMATSPETNQLEILPPLAAYERKSERRAQELRKKYFVDLGVKANRLQKHFRQQIDY